MKKILLLASLLGITISAQATTLQCPPANAISYSFTKKTWVLENAYTSQWGQLTYNLPGKTEGERVDPLAALRTQAYRNGGSMYSPVCSYTQWAGTKGNLNIILFGKNAISFDPALHPSFHIHTGSGGSLYECITSAANPEACQL